MVCSTRLCNTCTYETSVLHTEHCLWNYMGGYYTVIGRYPTLMWQKNEKIKRKGAWNSYSVTTYLVERYFIGELNGPVHVNNMLIKIKINTRCVNFQVSRINHLRGVRT